LAALKYGAKVRDAIIRRQNKRSEFKTYEHPRSATIVSDLYNFEQSQSLIDINNELIDLKHMADQLRENGNADKANELIDILSKYEQRLSLFKLSSS
jgi:hypothetical protein